MRACVRACVLTLSQPFLIAVSALVECSHAYRSGRVLVDGQHQLLLQRRQRVFSHARLDLVQDAHARMQVTLHVRRVTSSVVLRLDHLQHRRQVARRAHVHLLEEVREGEHLRRQAVHERVQVHERLREDDALGRREPLSVPDPVGESLAPEQGPDVGGGAGGEARVHADRHLDELGLLRAVIRGDGVGEVARDDGRRRRIGPAERVAQSAAHVVGDDRHHAADEVRVRPRRQLGRLREGAAVAAVPPEAVRVPRRLRRHPAHPLDVGQTPGQWLPLAVGV